MSGRPDVEADDLGPPNDAVEMSADDRCYSPDANLLLVHAGEALVELRQLAREVVVTAQRLQELRRGYAVAAAGELRSGSLADSRLRLGP